MKRFTYLKALLSPFKPFTLQWYIGKVAIGVPYFFPRKWVKDKEKPGYHKAVPLKIGFSYCDLGWKTKWEKTDYRYEWSPTLSFVFFNWQIACWIYIPNTSHYWESWLYYELITDKTKSVEYRLKQCIKGFPNIWTSYKAGGLKETTNYYTKILKNKWQYLVPINKHE